MKLFSFWTLSAQTWNICMLQSFAVYSLYCRVQWLQSRGAFRGEVCSFKQEWMQRGSLASSRGACRSAFRGEVCSFKQVWIQGGSLASSRGARNTINIIQYTINIHSILYITQLYIHSLLYITQLYIHSILYITQL